MSDAGNFAPPLLLGAGALVCVAMAILLWRGDRDASGRAPDALQRVEPVKGKPPSGFLARWATRRRSATWARHDRAQQRRRWLRRSVPTLSLIALAMVAGTAVLLLPDPPTLGGRRLWRATPRNCDEARSLGYGNARRGEEGYFAHLDADQDGVSCEPPPIHRR